MLVNKIDAVVITTVGSSPLWSISLAEVNEWLSTAGLIVALLVGAARLVVIIKSDGFSIKFWKRKK